MKNAITILPFKKLLLAFTLSGILLTTAYSQQESLLETQPTQYTSATPAHMWELGLHSGVPLGLGDIDFTPGIGGGIHIRKALDYVFSIRTELMLAKLKNEDTNDGNTETTWQSGSFELLASLNNLVWSDSKNRKTNLYGLVNVGVNRFKVDVTKTLSPDVSPLDYTVQTHGGVGLGFSARLTDRLNLGVESKALVLFGKDSDRLDAVNRQAGDVLSYSSLRLNINLGSKEKRSEPLYWVNPMDVMMRDVTELKNRPAFDLTDTDEDGVIDLLDQDNATPPGIQVDTRGLPLDSDGDGIPNHKDAEPYFPSDGVKKAIPAEPIATESDVERIVNKRLNEYNRTGVVPGNEGQEEKTATSSSTSSYQRTGRPSHSASLANWFLPLVHFDIDSYKVRPADHSNLASISNMLHADEGLKIVVTGFTDKTASKDYNSTLSFKRAESVVEYLVKHHQVPRSQLVLQYNGEDSPLVPSTGSNLMNRRVEFRAATGSDMDMMAPSPITSKNKKRRGF